MYTVMCVKQGEVSCDHSKYRDDVIIKVSHSLLISPSLALDDS